jgi:isopentenyl-diphosphate delta-isomerase
MNDARENVILVDATDRPVGTAPKLAAHRRGDLHRAFSVIIHDGAGKLLLQKRHAGKYHSGGLWTNACCGHPRPGEETQTAALRRLAEEMGFSCPLVPLSALLYRADVGGGFIEHEYVHLFAGRWHGTVLPDPDEAEAHAWRSLAAVEADAVDNPHRYTVWFRLYLSQAQAQLSAAMDAGCTPG